MELIELPDHETITWDAAVRKLADHLILKDSHLVTMEISPPMAHTLEHLPAGWAFFLVGAQTRHDNAEAVFHAPHAGPRLAMYTRFETSKVDLVRSLGIPVSYPLAVVVIPDALDVRGWAEDIGIDPALFADGGRRVCATSNPETSDIALVPKILTDALKIAYPDDVEEIDNMMTDLTPEDIARLNTPQERGKWS